MATMPATPLSGQPDAAPADWFGSAAGRALLDSESEALSAGLAEGRAGLPWLWIGPAAARDSAGPPGRGLRLSVGGAGLEGDVRCGRELPLASEAIGAIVLQHVLTRVQADALLAECARVLVPGGRLAIFALNPLAPYRWRWRGAGLQAAEPLVWRRRLRQAGLSPEPLSLGVGPAWRPRPEPGLQQGAGLRAAYLLRADKRSLPLTPVRRRSRRLAAAPA